MKRKDLHRALSVLREEHERLAAVLHGMLYFVRSIEQGGTPPDFKVFRAMLLYIAEVPERVHHPKEDQHLFALLRKRTSTLDEVLDMLEIQHARGERLARQLEHALTRYELLGAPAFEPFRRAAEEYVGFYLRHVGLEEEEIFPAAERLLSKEDWSDVNEAFEENESALAEKLGEREYERLFSTIVRITPAPIGLAAPV